jgi:S-DNA-T family DNA segregation ATPase FtsK/SpoIIIE
MPSRRPARLDLAALTLFLSGLLVALSILSQYAVFSKANSYPASHGSNLLGPAGASLAEVLYDALGVAVLVLLIGWFALVVFFVWRRSIWGWILRLCGWLLLLPCAAVIADTLGPERIGGPLIGSGGSIGAWLALWLRETFQPAGQIIIVGACLILSLTLALDFVLVLVVRGSWRLLRYFGHFVRWLWRAGAARRPPVPIVRILEEPFVNAGPAATPAAPQQQIPIHHAIVRPGPTSEQNRFADYELPPLTLLADPEPFPYQEHDQHLRDRAAVLEKTFKDFNINVRVVGINTGPVITQYEVALETGLRIHKVTRLADDLALNLRVPSVRMAPIPGKNTVGVEIPNEHRAVVRLKEVMLTAAPKAAKAKIPLFLGKDTEGRPLIYDLSEMPHLLIAGRTGTGKSVCMNAIILSILMTRRPDDVKMIMIDPKMLELSEYGKIPHLMHPVVKDMRKAEAILAWAVDKMEERYDLLSRARVRSIAGYNELTPDEIYRRVAPADDDERARIPDRMPYIVIFVDEMNDLMMTMKKEVEGHIIRLAQKSRAAGIHLVVATQKPTVDVITGLIKSNLPARICFQVSSRSDSRVVLDEMGADKLLGKGDMLFLQPGTSTLIRAQGTYTGDEEITRVVKHLECDPCYARELIQLNGSSKDGKGSLMETLRARDELYEASVEVVIREGRGSVSLLQRALGIGYGRAARLIDFMAEDGIVGNYNGSQAREVLYTPEQWEQMKQTGQPTHA